jgi:Cu/Ag efflux protein CusF
MRRMAFLSALLLTASVVFSITQQTAAAKTPSSRFVSTAGKVTAVNAAQNQIIIKDESGKDITLVVSESTAITRDGKSATLADLKPGDWVTSEGEESGGAYKVTSIKASTGKPKM